MTNINLGLLLKGKAKFRSKSPYLHRSRLPGFYLGTHWFLLFYHFKYIILDVNWISKQQSIICTLVLYTQPKLSGNPFVEYYLLYIWACLLSLGYFAHGVPGVKGKYW